MIERMESMTWACSLRETATPVPRQATQHHTLYATTPQVSLPRLIMPRTRIELVTRGFSILCSTD